jgi:hypothetical protein
LFPEAAYQQFREYFNALAMDILGFNIDINIDLCYTAFIILDTENKCLEVKGELYGCCIPFL